MTNNCRVTDLGDGRLAVETPYNPGAVARLKRLMGRWQVCFFGPERVARRAWVVAAEHRAKVDAIIAEFWPPADQKVERIYCYDSGVHIPRKDEWLYEYDARWALVRQEDGTYVWPKDGPIPYRARTNMQEAPTLDGAKLLGFNRDWRSDVSHPDIVEILFDGLCPGGSRNHPAIAGVLVVRCRVRPGAKAEWGTGKDAVVELSVQEVGT